MKKGILLINLGTPSAPTTQAIRYYLRPFLMDRRVITLPALFRYLLVYGLILPFRPRRLVKAYQAIWTPQGSPLMKYSLSLQAALQQKLQDTHIVSLGMRYGEPSLAKALEPLKNCEKITILPLYPQYASSSSGSAIEAALNELKKWDVVPHLEVIRDFYQQPHFIQGISESLKPYLKRDAFVLFSYHGLPQNHLTASDCLHCTGPCVTHTSTRCYRAQCYDTTRRVAETLQLPNTNYQTSFQSRLGRTPWIQPYTDEVLQTLAKRGIKDLIVICPSFVADCLETLEEIGLRAKEEWKNLTGHTLTVVPCLNDHPLLIAALLAYCTSTH